MSASDAAARRRRLAYSLRSYFFESELVKSFGLMFAATGAGNVINYLYNLAVGRMLGPEQFGVFTSMLSLVIIFSGLASSLQTIMTRYVAVLKAEGRYQEIRKFFRKSLGLFLWLGLAFFALIASSSPFIAKFLKLDSIWPVLAVAAFVLVAMISPSPMGVLQGTQSFKHLSGLSVAGPALRFVLGILLIVAGAGVSGAVGSSALGGAVVFLVSVFFASKLTAQGEGFSSSGIGRSSILKFSAYTLVCTFLILAVSNVDMMLAKHYFSAHEAGIYGSVVTVGKVVLYLPMAMSVVLLPKTAEIGRLDRASASLFFKSALITLLLCFLVDAVYFLAPKLVVVLMFGKSFLPAVPYIGLYGLAMSFISLLQLGSTYLLSIYDKALLPLLALTLLCQLVLFNLFKRSLFTYVLMLSLISFVASVLLLCYVALRAFGQNGAS